MPWKIQKDSTPLGEDAKIHFADRHAELHLIVYLQDGVVDLYIGADTSEEAQIFLNVDAEEVDPLKLITVRWPSVTQIGIIDNVLSTMGIHHERRADLRRLIQKKKDSQRRSRLRQEPEILRRRPS